MADDKNPFGNWCEITVRIPWEVAEQLAEYGGGLIAEIREAVEVRKDFLARQELDRRRHDWMAARRKRRNASIARRAASRLRKRLSASNRTRQQIIGDLAGEFGLPVAAMAHLVSRQNFQARQRIARWRRVRVIRLYMAGVARPEIAARLNTTEGAVIRILSENRDLVSELRAFRDGLDAPPPSEDREAGP